MMNFRSRQRAGRTAAALAAACCILGAISNACLAQTWPPKGEPVKLPVTRDNWMSSAGGETKGNNGGANKFKLKGRQEYAIFDVDVGGLKGKIVTGAMFHFHTTTPNAPALRVTVSSVATPWVEGAAYGYKPQPGSSCYAQPELGYVRVAPKVPSSKPE